MRYAFAVTIEFILLLVVSLGAGGRVFAQDGRLEYAGSTLWNGAEDIAVRGNIAFCAMPSGLQVLDFTDPKAPVIRSQVYIPDGTPEQLRVERGFVYVGRGRAGLYIVDVTDLDAARVVGRVDQFVQAVHVSGAYAYISDGRGWLMIVNVDDPENPAIIAVSELGGSIVDFAAEGDTLFLAAGLSGVVVVDVSNKSAPVKIAKYNLRTVVQSVAVREHTLYCFSHSINGNYLDVLDVSHLDSILLVGTLFFPRWGGQSADLALMGNYLCVASDGMYALVIDITDPSAPSAVAQFPSSSYSVSGLDFDGEFLFLSEVSDGIKAYVLNELGWPSLVGQIRFWRPSTPVVVAGGYAFARSPGDGLLIINLADATRPQVVASYELQKYIYDVAISGHYAYIAGEGHISGVDIVDISNPAVPTHAGFADTSGYVTGVKIKGSVAYLAKKGSGFVFVNIADPDAPLQLGEYEAPDFAGKFAIWDSLLCYSTDSSSLKFINIAHLSNPRLVSEYRTLDYINDLAMRDGYAFVLSNEYTDFYFEAYGYLQILDVSKPQKPAPVGRWYSEMYPSGSNGLAIDGDFVYVLSSDFSISARVSAVDISDVYNPLTVSTFEAPGYPGDIDADDGVICFTNNVSLTVLQMTPPMDANGPDLLTPSEFGLEQNFPNPFNAGTTIRATIEAPCKAELSIYNLLGRKVVNLYSGELGPGVHSFDWNGLTDSGEEMPSGLYFYRLRAGEQTVTRKMVLMK